jgi:replicative DNA helicase
MSIKDAVLGSMHADKTIPWAKADGDEQHLLAAILRDTSESSDAYYEAVGVVSQVSFRVEANRYVWKAIDALMSGGGAVTPGRVKRYLERQEKLDLMGGGAYIDNLRDLRSADPGEILEYARAVEAAFDEREFQRACDEAARSNMSLARRYDKVEQAMSAQRARQNKSHRQSFAEIVPAVEELERIRVELGAPPQLPVGIGDLDYLLGGDLEQGFKGGIGQGKIIYVGGPEKVGKTRFATAMVKRMLFDHNAIVDWWSVEMTTKEMLHHFVASLTGIPVYCLEHNIPPRGVTRADFEYRRREAREWLMTRDFHFNNPEGLCDRDILTLTKGMMRKHAEAIASGRPYIVVVDYIQDVQSSSGARDERAQILKACKALKTCAKTYGATVLGIYHSNRGPDAAEPQAHDVYGSAQLGKDVDQLLMLWRPEREHPKFKFHMRVFARRNRGGAQGHADFYADLSCCQYREWNDMTDCEEGDDLESHLLEVKVKAKEVATKGGKK